MKKIKLVILIVLISYVSLMNACEDSDGHNHEAHTHNEHDHTGHSHETDGHNHDEHEYHDHNGSDHDHDEHAHEQSDLIQIEEEWEKMIDLKLDMVKVESIDRQITTPGQIVPDQNNIAVISPFIESSVNCVFKNIGDRVNKGDLLACLVSPEIGILRAEYDKAKAELEIKTQNFERQQKLFKENIVSNKSFQEAELDKRLAEVNYHYALKKLLAMGIKEEELDEPPRGHSEAIGSTIHIYAPIDGVITHRNASIGQKAGPSTTLFDVINLSSVWVEADVFEKDLKQVKKGQNVKINVSAYEQETFSGEIFYIGNTLNDETRTIKIMIEIKNDQGKLKPGMFATTNIVVGNKEKALVAPKESILDDEGLNIVFVKKGRGYQRRIVQTGIESNRFVEITSGLDAGDIVVTNGNYQLKSKMKMTGIDPHAGHVH